MVRESDMQRNDRDESDESDDDWIQASSQFLTLENSFHNFQNVMKIIIIHAGSEEENMVHLLRMMKEVIRQNLQEYLYIYILEHPIEIN